LAFGQVGEIKAKTGF